MIEEIWKEITGYEGLYEVSNKGKVRSLDRYVKFRNSKMFKKGKELKQNKAFNSLYSYVELRDSNGKRKTCFVHRLVALAFVENDDPINKIEVDHIIPLIKGGTNEAINLRWVTKKENMKYAVDNNLYKNNKNNLTNEQRQEYIKKATEACKKKVIMLDKITESEIKEFDSLSEAMTFLGKEGSPTKISAVCKGSRKTAYGYKWKYK